MTRRQSIEVPGFSHGAQPIPAACRIGNLIVTGGVHGLDPQTGKVAEDAERQCALMFDNLRRILLAGGASPDDVIKMTVYMKDASVRDYVNKEWLAMFPDAHSRPARHSIQNPHLAGNMLVQCVVTALTGE